MVTTSYVKKMLKAQGLNTSAMAITEVNEFLGKLLLKAAEKAKSDGRKTVMSRDIQTALLETK